jgi:hypothetical protein
VPCGFQRNFLKQKLIVVNSFNAFFALSLFFSFEMNEKKFQPSLSHTISKPIFVALKFDSGIIRNIFFFGVGISKKLFAQLYIYVRVYEFGSKALVVQMWKGENIQQQGIRPSLSAKDH